MPMFGIQSTLRYEIVGEYASLFLSLLILIFMSLTKPRQSKAFSFLVWGNFTSIIATILMIVIVEIASNTEYYSRGSFTVLLIVFLILYSFILVDTFNYINLMSERRIKRRDVIVMIYIFVAVAYFSGAIYQVAMKNFYYVRTDGIDITHFTRYYCIAGMICATICFVMCFQRRATISRIVMRGIYIVIPLEFVVLMAQILDRNSIFSAATYTMPFIAIYLLFHSNPYDEDTGCQNVGAMESRFITNNRMGRVFYLAYIEFPQLLGNSRNPNYEVLTLELADVCRKIERISRNIHMYRVNYGTFIAIMEVKERSDAENYADQMHDILDEFCRTDIDHIHYFLGIGGDSRRFVAQGNKWTQFFMKYIKQKYMVDGQNVYVFANGNDFRSYDNIYNIEQTLADIRAKMNPDDDRILCYAQPIYSVEKESFRSAEALMRLCIDGRMIPPDEFIKIAENTGCIHSLTVIMMHKVCKAVEELSEQYDFDALTINCSTADFVDREFYKEIMDIIHTYNIDQKKIRLELTESMMADSYDAVKHNMNMLNMEGIQLYMDDFGTGYSNLERVLDVPVQTIKFDKSLLYKSIQDSRVEDIISYMIDTFKKNGFITLVEGVEDELQKNYSIKRGFDYIQGYHYAKPMPIENLSKYFNKK
ncbi:EAL domain-containing protein [Butyrivibrio sp. MB2005]|uniref:EAL domain-containing protein n=1 Tax=Butyrivibrio sp. MB2005 TaxID=1280678 RepID=UPI000429D472|nr:EAL domain-containing protein [Butyrivibrio sp. MB2005]